MKFITFLENAEEKIGIISKDNKKVIDINKTLGSEFYDMTEFIWSNEEYIEKLVDIYEKNEKSTIYCIIFSINYIKTII